MRFLPYFYTGFSAAGGVWIVLSDYCADEGLGNGALGIHALTGVALWLSGRSHAEGRVAAALERHADAIAAEVGNRSGEVASKVVEQMTAHAKQTLLDLCEGIAGLSGDHLKSGSKKTTEVN